MIEEIEAFYKTAKLPKCMYLMPCAWIHNVQNFVDSHLSHARLNFGKHVNPYLLRLIELKNILSKNMIENETQLAVTKGQLENFKNAYAKTSKDKTMGEVQRNVYMNSYKSMIEELEYQIDLYEKSK